MGEINISRDEQDALRAVNTDVLDKLISQGVYERRIGNLHLLNLASCGPYVASQLRAFEQALVEHGKAKSANKLAETKEGVRHAGSDLADAVRQMKHRVETEENEGQLFYVDDQIIWPDSFSEQLTVRVSYRWRRAIEDDWTYGDIAFYHRVDSWPDYVMSTTKRKASASILKQALQAKLSREWKQLMGLALHSVREYFRAGGDGSTIPPTFQAVADSYSRGLNNHSADFWRELS